MSDDAVAASSARPMPLLYSRPVPLERARHSAKGLRTAAGYGFARAVNSLPLNAAEFAHAVRDYPIVFTAEPPTMALAVLGLRDRENLMVDAEGRWAEGTYVPAYARRYPFILMEQADAQRYTLCIDEASEMVVESGGAAFFDGERPSQLTEKATRLCSLYQRHHMATRAFCDAVEEQGLLVPRSVTARGPDGGEIALGGFRVIDEQAFNGLPDPLFLDWRRRGWLGLVYLHFASVHNWSRLGRRAGR